MSLLGKVELTLEEYNALMLGTQRTVKRAAKKLRSTATKKTRKASPYQKEVGRQLKKLKAKHPRTPVTSLMKRAHRAAKKARRSK